MEVYRRGLDRDIKIMCSYSGQISNLQVETNDENVPGHPHHEPGCILQDRQDRQSKGSQTRFDKPVLKSSKMKKKKKKKSSVQVLLLEKWEKRRRLHF